MDSEAVQILVRRQLRPDELQPANPPNQRSAFFVDYHRKVPGGLARSESALPGRPSFKDQTVPLLPTHARLARVYSYLRLPQAVTPFFTAKSGGLY